MRAFVQIREMLSAHKELAHKLEELERKVGIHDQTIVQLIAAVRQLYGAARREKESDRVHIRREDMKNGTLLTAFMGKRGRMTNQEDIFGRTREECGS